jgi:alkylation response protein AidB-like acyl-CoA dehydrogenase
MQDSNVLEEVGRIAAGFAAGRHDRQRRRELDREDFDALRRAGFHLTGVPVAAGGLFESVPKSTRSVGQILRKLASGDSSVALVASMHPAVLSFWLATPDVPEPHSAAWAEQRAFVFKMAREGAQFGTITSEPGSGGDILGTKAVARPGGADGTWLLTGQKHFGSGSGVTSFMVTSGRPEGEDQPDWFFLDVRGIPWDGTRGMTLSAPWDGHGMAATQSHGMTFDDFPASRFAWPGHWKELSDKAGPFIGTIFTSVILGIVDAAMSLASEQLGKKKAAMRAYEQVEWANAEQEAWLMRQAYEGMLRAVETEPLPLRSVLLGKTACAGLAEECLRRIVRVMGGGTYARHSPFGFWFEDVRALGFLRPPWPLAYQALIDSALPG